MGTSTHSKPFITHNNITLKTENWYKSRTFNMETDLLDELVVTEDDDTNVVRLQVKGHALQARAEKKW